jgi:hypothetical protein
MNREGSLLSSYERLTELDENMRRFVHRQEMLFLATGEGRDARAERNCTFVTGGPGFVRVLDVKRLAWPEYTDGEESASVLGIRRDPEVSLLFVDFARGAVGLHINGRAKVLGDTAMRRAYRQLTVDPTLGIVSDRPPSHWVTVYVEEAYLAQSEASR